MKMEIVYLPLKSLKPYEGNAKRHPKEQIQQIIASIEMNGFNDPVAVWGDGNTIVEGHGRVEALKKMGWAECPCIRLDHLTDEQRRAYTLIHNKLTINSDFDLELLDFELEQLPEFDMEQFGFELQEVDEYAEFVEKFEPKKTTDDCYTPDGIFEAVQQWAVNEYGLHGRPLVRPFYPGGDYASFVYPPDCVVLDNPPFSILAEIKRFYIERGIDFFLYAPGLTLFSSQNDGLNYVIADATITYENGAKVQTGFVTSLGDAFISIAPELKRRIKDAHVSTAQELKGHVYPDNVISSAMLSKYVVQGNTLRIPRSDCHFIRRLDAQAETGDTIFGSGFLVSDHVAAELKAAELKAAELKAAELKAAEHWELSTRELEIIELLGH